MEIFNVPRGCGKTTHLIMEATKTGCPIVVGLQTQKKYLEETIKKSLTSMLMYIQFKKS
ncbi:hypothetical protein [Coprococcus sp. RTP21281st1_F1_RTP21281_210402]|uniref:hypothetical protein n=1 Tax=Coprococcus sp. RTP21281st1_F1_RTP21281_210402 TaxID=3143208 RepID=UPI0034A1EDCE